MSRTCGQLGGAARPRAAGPMRGVPIFKLPQGPSRSYETRTRFKNNCNFTYSALACFKWERPGRRLSKASGTPDTRLRLWRCLPAWHRSERDQDARECRWVRPGRFQDGREFWPGFPFADFARDSSNPAFGSLGDWSGRTVIFKERLRYSPDLS